jgi:ABC-2 type transport system ATP-binding protein
MGLLTVEAVSKQYGSYTALNQVSLDIREGCIYGLLGPNGAGKTSLIRIINQITAPDSGKLYFNGEPLAGEHIAQIGYLPEERGLYPKMKVGAQLLYLAQLKGLSKPEAKARLKEWFERMDMSAWWDKKVEELSKGMAQKVQFVSTVLHKPRLLIFDEPFTGFDPINTNLIKGEIKRLAAEGATIIFSTHRMESVEEICEEITLINKANIILQGKLNEVKDTYKQNIFTAHINTSDTIERLEQGKLLHQQLNNNLLKVSVQLPNGSTNKLVHELSNFGQLQHFSEEIPSLNDIFIQKVANHA